jgi:hypothetical protein
LGSKCVDVCPSEGYFSNLKTQECQKCFPTCKTCSNGEAGGCTSCKEGTFKVDGKCEEECPFGYFKKNASFSGDTNQKQPSQKSGNSSN